MGINKDNITSLEIDLIDACNLSCPLCNRNKFNSKTGYLELTAWKNIIGEFQSLEKIYFIGTRSEHTLYPEFLELCRWVKGKKINIILSTNGCTNKVSWWGDLAEILDVQDEVRFAIDGTDQETYAKYRVGGNLDRVLANHERFKSDKENDVIQYIEFEHNRHENISNISGGFSKVRVINSSQSEIEIQPRTEFINKYKALNGLAKVSSGRKLSCETKNELLFINNLGNISPCCHYNEHRTLVGDIWDETYDDIENGRFKFCTPICGDSCKALRDDLGIEL